jgi:putative DNA primase/helicase
MKIEIEKKIRELTGWERWNTVGMAVFRATGGSDEGFEIFDKWSAKNPKYNSKNTRDRWYKAYRRSPPKLIGAGTLFAIAEYHSPGWQQKYEEAALYAAFEPIPDEGAAPKINGAAPANMSNGASAKSNPDPIIHSSSSSQDQPHAGASKPGTPKPDAPDTAPLLSEDYLALQFTKAHAETLRYVAKWGKWLIYDGAKWNDDEKLQAFTMARNICRTAAKPISRNNKNKEAKTVASARTRAAVISLAQSDPCHAASVDQWDTDPWLLNTPDGVIDLKTGLIRDHDPADYLTKITAVTPDRAMPIPLWRKFLITITANDIRLQNYIRRMLGYALTGITIEHALFFWYGTGANGKGVLMNTVAKIMSDYHKTASQDTFTTSTNERHPTDLAMLRGARLVTVSETEQGKRWAESRIKMMTGGDPITARFMRQDFFEYDPQFKLMISGQHRPGLNAVNEALRRRINMLPFTVTIPEKERDKKLTEKLKTEWPGILAWMIEGCLEWQRIGLQPPQIVVDATSDYLKSEDKLGRWIDECCERKDGWWTSSSDLFHSWKSWAEENNQYIGSHMKFSTDLQEAGFEKEDRRSANGFMGLKLLPREPFSEHGDKTGRH